MNFSAQQILLSSYYEKMKVSITEERLREIIDTLESEEKTPGEVQDIISSFSKKNKAAVEIVDEWGNWIFGNISKFEEAYIKVLDENGEEYYVVLGEIEERDAFKEDRELVTEGVLFKYSDELKVIVPYYINIGQEKYSATAGSGNEESKDGQIKLTGRIEEVSPVSKKPTEIFYQYKALYDQIMGPDRANYSEFIHDRNISRIKYSDKFDGGDFITFITSINVFDGDYVIIESISIDSIEDTIEILKIFSKYALGFVVILTIIAVYIYSKSITRPIMNLKKRAGKMAELDFSELCQVKSKDEIAELGKSLNMMARNLDLTLKELRVANDSLEKDIQLQKKREKAAKELIANMSHELKTPITVIEGILKGIQTGVYDLEDGDYVSSIEEETKRMKELIFDMLELSKLESDVYEIKEEIFDITGVTLKVHSKLKKIAKEKELEIGFNVEEALVLGDKKKIESVITNFYSNAIRYTDKGQKIVIEIIENEGGIEFSIENKGAHIEDEDIKDIWKPFYRVEKSRSREYGGTGLGLQIVKGILELHKSQYGVSNTPDGVRFYFTMKKYNGDYE